MMRSSPIPKGETLGSCDYVLSEDLKFLLDPQEPTFSGLLLMIFLYISP